MDSDNVSFPLDAAFMISTAFLSVPFTIALVVARGGASFDELMLFYMLAIVIAFATNAIAFFCVGVVDSLVDFLCSL